MVLLRVGTWWQEAEDLRERSGPGSFLWSFEVTNRVGAVIALVLRPTSVSPNAVTVAGAITHVVGSLYVALLTPPVSMGAAVLAVIIWQCAYGLDGADGLLARERRETSAFGAWLDQIADGVNHSSVLIAIVLFLVRSLELPPTAAVLLLGVLLASNLLVLFGWALRTRIINDVGNPAENLRERTSHLTPRTVLGLGVLQATDYGVFLFIAAALLVWPAGLLAYVVISGLLWTSATLGSVVRLWPRR